MNHGGDGNKCEGRPRQNVYSFLHDESKTQFPHISSILARLQQVDRQQKKQRTKDYIPILLNGKVTLGFLDSGNNLPGIAMSLSYYLSLGLNPNDLIRNPDLTKVATAKSGFLMTKNFLYDGNIFPCHGSIFRH